MFPPSIGREELPGSERTALLPRARSSAVLSLFLAYVRHMGQDYSTEHHVLSAFKDQPLTFLVDPQGSCYDRLTEMAYASTLVPRSPDAEDASRRTEREFRPFASRRWRRVLFWLWSARHRDQDEDPVVWEMYEPGAGTIAAPQILTYLSRLFGRSCDGVRKLLLVHLSRTPP